MDLDDFLEEAGEERNPYGNLFDECSINGIFEDDGTPIDPMSIPKPPLCVICFHDDEEDEIEHSLCLLNRHAQREEKEFECGQFLRRTL